MNLTNNTVLITGGTSGIGLEFALQLARRKNTIIISGRNHQALAQIKREHPEFATVYCDIQSESQLIEVAETIKRDFPSLNMLINNAGSCHCIDLVRNRDLSILEEDIRTNLIGPVKLINLLLCTLMKSKEAAIINITSGIAYAPLASVPMYCATKSALHAFSIAMRHQLRSSSVKVFEVLPPTVETTMYKAMRQSTGSKRVPSISPEEFVRKTLEHVQKDVYESRVGQTALLYYLSRFLPSLACWMVNHE